MVGDSLAHDVEGARASACAACCCTAASGPLPDVDVPVIRNLTDLPPLL